MTYAWTHIVCHYLHIINNEILFLILNIEKVFIVKRQLYAIFYNYTSNTYKVDL